MHLVVRLVVHFCNKKNEMFLMVVHLVVHFPLKIDVFRYRNCEQTRLIFIACVVEGKKYREVADECGISVNTVNTYVKRAYKYLRRRMGLSVILFLYFISENRSKKFFKNK